MRPKGARGLTPLQWNGIVRGWEPRAREATGAGLVFMPFVFVSNANASRGRAPHPGKASSLKRRSASNRESLRDAVRSTGREAEPPPPPVRLSPRSPLSNPPPPDSSPPKARECTRCRARVERRSDHSPPPAGGRLQSRTRRGTTRVDVRVFAVWRGRIWGRGSEWRDAGGERNGGGGVSFASRTTPLCRAAAPVEAKRRSRAERRLSDPRGAGRSPAAAFAFQTRLDAASTLDGLDRLKPTWPRSLRTSPAVGRLNRIRRIRTPLPPGPRGT